MFCFTAFTVLFYLQNVEAAVDDNYVFYYRRPEFFDFDFVRRILPDVDREVESLRSKIEVNCRFMQAAEEYENLQREARRCTTSQDRLTLKNAISGFKTAREECINKADCRSNLPQAVEKTATSIENIDAAANKEVTACGTDNPCKYSAYIKTHNNIFSLYLSSRPELRLLKDEVVASNDCTLAIVKCMVDRNEASLRSMYEGITRLRECREGAGPGLLASYANRASRREEPSPEETFETPEVDGLQPY